MNADQRTNCVGHVERHLLFAQIRDFWPIGGCHKLGRMNQRVDLHFAPDRDSGARRNKVREMASHSVEHGIPAISRLPHLAKATTVPSSCKRGERPTSANKIISPIAGRQHCWPLSPCQRCTHGFYGRRYVEVKPLVLSPPETASVSRDRPIDVATTFERGRKDPAKRSHGHLYPSWP